MPRGVRRCPAHERAYLAVAEEERGTAYSRGYTPTWSKARTAYLYQHPLCVRCSKDGRVTAAGVVDHIVPHRGDMRLFWDESNWQALCKPCHDSKTAKEDGGYGLPAKSVVK